MTRHFRTNSLEVDITLRCDVLCANCTRRCDILKPEKDMDPEFLRRELFGTQHPWKRIFLMGGEPTMHPDVTGFMDVLLEYKREVSPDCDLWVCSNCNGKRSEEILQEAESRGIFVRRAYKDRPTEDGTETGRYWTLNVAPVDFPEFDGVDYSTGCMQQYRCGFQLTTSGWYCCSVMGGIDRVFGIGGGKLEDELVHPRMSEFCQYCGRLRVAYAKKEGGGTQEFEFPSVEAYARFKQSLEEYPLNSPVPVLSPSYVRAINCKQAGGLYGRR